jgi:hypothetical protein
MRRGWNSELQTYDLGQDIYESLLDPFNKHSERILIVGSVGAGKSYAALTIAYAVALRFSMKFHGSTDHWRSYFSPETHLACIDPEAIRSLMLRGRKRYNCYVYDDVQAGGWGNRNWQSAGNKMMNALFSTQRVDNTVLIVTAQAEKQIDSGARLLFSRYCEMSDQHAYSMGTNFMKAFWCHLVPRDRTNPVWYIYPRIGDVAYEQIALFAPPREITDVYDKLRADALDKLADKGIEAENGKDVKRDTKKEVSTPV